MDASFLLCIFLGLYSLREFDVNVLSAVLC